MTSLILRRLISLTLIFALFEIVVAEGKEMKSICSWTMNQESLFKCDKTEFQCLNNHKCIKRSWYCDNGNDCGDNSDEYYCGASDSCPTALPFIKCSGSRKCIPVNWICNGHSDCPEGEDEDNCGTPNLQVKLIMQPHLKTALSNVNEWLYNKAVQSSSEKWGTNVDRSSLIHYFANEDFVVWPRNETLNEMAYELNIQLLSRLTRMKLKDIPSTELASYVNAFLLTCVNPRNFHGYDIIQEMRNRVEKENYTNPYVVLALCNAGETITESDKKKLTDTFWNTHRTFWTDMQAVVVMALACASKQPGNEVDSETLREMTLELKQQQYRNGTVVNLSTTALVMQALISTDSERDPDNFDETKALHELLRNQKSDGSFGDLVNTLLVTPVLACRSLVDINSDHCRFGTRDEISALENLSRRSGPKVRVQYSLWIGNEKDLERNVILRVPENMSLYGVMEIAAEVDSRFKFEYTVKNRKPYINAISGMRDNPLTGKYWFLYFVQNGQPTISNESPADIIPKENDHYIMWYRSGTWVD